MKRNAVRVKRKDMTAVVNRNHTTANPIFVNKVKRNLQRKKSWIFAGIKKTEITLLLQSNRKNACYGFVNRIAQHTCVYAV
jgi:hypothetical protein